MTARRPHSPDPTTAPPSTMNGRPKSPSSKPTPSSSRSPFLPTLIEAILLSIYPLTLLLGSSYSYTTVNNARHPYNPTTQSHDPATAPSYFARKNNVFNTYFVKVGWFWTTLAFAALQYSIHHTTTGRSPKSPRAAGEEKTTRLLRAAARYAAVTAAWLFTTQWFFGPPLIDRSFTLSGGACDLRALDLGPDARVSSVGGKTPLESVTKVEDILSSAACRAAGGTWRDGHDISGHVFLLVLGSGMLVLEALPAVLRRMGVERDVRDERGEREVVEVEEELGLGVKGALAVAGLSWWMLLMTAAYFHTWFEKITGLMVAGAALWVVYFLPRGVPVLKGLMGSTGL